jgi:hypothetical protein
MERDEERLVNGVSDYTVCYQLAKALTFVYLTIIISWNASELGKSANVHIAILALSLVGIFVVPFPRMYLEYKWFSLKSEGGSKYRDFRTHSGVIFCNIMNLMFFIILYALIDEKYHLTYFGSFLRAIISSWSD